MALDSLGRFIVDIEQPSFIDVEYGNRRRVSRREQFLETMDVLAQAGELSAAECSQTVGISRVSARRYLEHFAEQGQAVVRLRYGTGRPERRYGLR